jgi:hypothetical protein
MWSIYIADSNSLRKDFTCETYSNKPSSLRRVLFEVRQLVAGRHRVGPHRG